MKYLILVIALTFSFAAQAQNAAQMEMLKRYQSMSPEELQAEAAKMQQDMNRIGECMDEVDYNQMQALETRGKAIAAKIKQLCAAGQEKEAQAYAMSKGQAMMNDPTVKKIKSCSQHMVRRYNFTPGKDENGKPKPLCEEAKQE